MSDLALLGGTPVRTRPFPKYPVLGEEEIAAATEVIRAGNLCSQMGYQVEAFESEFAAYCGADFGVATSSGTTALHAALAACGVGVGDEVIVPPYTFLSTATSVLMQNAIPVFADVEPDTLGLDPDEVKAKITPRTKAVIVVHMHGYPTDLDGLMAVAEEHDLFVIEDCSHAHGAEYHGHKVGTIGHLGAFSFQQRKNLSIGEGGIVIARDEGLAAKAKAFRSFGPLPLAYNFRMTELHGAIGRVRLRRLDEQNASRIQNAQYLDRNLADLPGLAPQVVRPETEAVYYNYVIRCAEEELGISRDRLVEAVRAEGIPLSLIYYPLYRHQTFQALNAYGHGSPFRCLFYDVPDDERPSYGDGMCPVTEAACDRQNVELKVHPPATVQDMADVVAAFQKVVVHVDELKARTP